MSVLGRQEFARVVTNSSLGELSIRCALAKERTFGSLCLAPSRLCPTYFFADLALYLFPTIHLICEYG